MDNVKINYNKFQENFSKTSNDSFKKNSIFFSGMCYSSNFEFCDQFWNEITLKNSITVPECYDPIDQIDTINTDVEIISSKVIKTPSIPTNEKCIKNFENKLTTERKLIVTGFLCLTINYISIYKKTSVKNFNIKIPFSDFIVLSKEVTINDTITDPLNVEFVTSACLENTTVTEINNKNIKLTTNMFITACCSECMKPKNICSLNNNLTPEIYGLCSKNALDNLLKSDINSINYWNQISLSKICTLPIDKPDIIQILSINSKFKIINEKLIYTPKANRNNFNNLSITGKKLIVNALLHQRIDYISKTDTRQIISLDVVSPISSYITLPENLNYNTKFNIYLCLENIELCTLSGRQVFLSSAVFLKAKPKQCININ